MEVMKPVSEVRNCDCMEFMRSLPDNFFDLSIVDAPYGINCTNMKMGENNGYESSSTKSRKGRLNSGAGKLKNRVLNTANCDWDFEPPKPEFWVELKRISKNQIIWGGNYYDLPPTRCIICWDKEQPWENFSQVELAWTSFDKPAKLFRMGSRGGSVPDMRQYEKFHPTQKPIDLYGYCLAQFANKGDRIFDPMMGSQSSRIAAYKMGFDFWGCEIDEFYFNKGCERFNQICLGETKLVDGRTIKQLDIFG